MATGGRRNQFAGYGYKYHRDEYTGRVLRVPDPEQRELMERLIEWRHAGWTWGEIRDQITAEGMQSPRGTPWCERSLQRLHTAGLRVAEKQAPA